MIMKVDYKVTVPDLNKMVDRDIRQGWHRFGGSLRAEASNEVIRGTKSGRTYYNVRLPGGKVKRRHVASAPGESHANLSGKLRRSLGYQITGSRSMEFGYMRNPPEYSGAVEFGSQRAGPRPTLRNAINKLIKMAGGLWRIGGRS